MRKEVSRDIRALVFRILFILYVLAVGYLCFANFSRMSEIPKDLFGLPADKVVHFIMFFPFAILVYLSGRQKRGTVLQVLASVGICWSVGCIFAGLTEIVQGAMPYRTEDIKDFYSDVSSITLSSLILTAVELHRMKIVKAGKGLTASLLVGLFCCPVANAQKVPAPTVFDSLCVTLSSRLLEKTGVESELSVYQLRKNGKKLDTYFTNTLSDYPWHKVEQEWFREVLDSGIRALAPGFILGRILTKYNSFEEFATPVRGNDGKPAPYSITKPDPRNSEHKRFIEKLDGMAFPKGMDDRYIALWQSHGRYFDEESSSWKWQRAPLHRTVEDMFTQSFVLPYLIPMLENAGAYVMTPRERDIQTREIIIDNDPSFPGERDPQTRKAGFYSEEGIWESVDIGFADFKKTYSFSDNPFRAGSSRTVSCSGSAKPDASAIWTPEIEERGFYAVYVSYQSCESSSPAARYTVRHIGGESTYLVNQSIGGGTWIYLGSFEFEKGRRGCVILDNSGASGKSVNADAVKIGGGMGKIERGGSVSGVPSYAEGAHYWMQWAGVDSTITRAWPNDYTDDYASRGAWTEMMKKEKGIPFDLCLAFHSDAGLKQNDSIVGTLAIYSYPWENKRKFDDGRSRMASRLLAEFVQDQIVSDIREDFEPEWNRRELWDRSYSESRTPGVPAMILELLSHQNFADMKYGLDPDFRFCVSRAVYKGLLKTLSTFYRTDYVVQPLPVNSFSAICGSGNTVVLSWKPTPDPKEPTAVPDKYIVYTRVDGGAFDAGTAVKGCSVQMTISPGHIYSYRVAACNQGGISFPSEVLSVGKASDSQGDILIVNNFDRVSAPAWIDLPDYAGFDGRLDGGVPYIRDISFVGENYEFRRSAEYIDDESPGFGASLTDKSCSIVAGNSFDYPYVHGKAFMALGYSFSSISRDAFCENAVFGNAVSSAPMVDLICGKQKTSFSGTDSLHLKYSVFPEELKKAIVSYIGQGGNLIVSGANIGSDQSASGFSQEVLGYKCKSFFGTGNGKIGDFRFYNSPNPVEYCVECPDAIAPAGLRSKTVLRYKATGQSAAVLYRGRNGKVFSIGVPIETLKSETDRKELLRMSLQALRNN